MSYEVYKRGEHLRKTQETIRDHIKTRNYKRIMDQGRRHSNSRWTLLGTSLPKSEIVYFCQMLLVYVIVITSIVNLSTNSGKM
jgi:hypothetical protein